MHVNRTTVGAAVALSTIVALGGCATHVDDDMPMTDGSVMGQAMHNDADVAFAQMMIPHHEQAVTMAGYALDRTSDPEVRALAEQIAGAQGPEISTMTGWLDDWGASAMSDHSGHAMPGMMSDAAMERLSGLSGKAFDRMFLRMMVAHHQGAIVMADGALTAGSDPEVRRLAQGIVEAQRAEIERMQMMLRQAR